MSEQNIPAPGEASAVASAHQHATPIERAQAAADAATKHVHSLSRRDPLYAGAIKAQGAALEELERLKVAAKPDPLAAPADGDYSRTAYHASALLKDVGADPDLAARFPAASLPVFLPQMDASEAESRAMLTTVRDNLRREQRGETRDQIQARTHKALRQAWGADYDKNLETARGYAAARPELLRWLQMTGVGDTPHAALTMLRAAQKAAQR